MVLVYGKSIEENNYFILFWNVGRFVWCESSQEIIHLRFNCSAVSTLWFQRHSGTNKLSHDIFTSLISQFRRAVNFEQRINEIEQYQMAGNEKYSFSSFTDSFVLILTRILTLRAKSVRNTNKSAFQSKCVLEAGSVLHCGNHGILWIWSWTCKYLNDTHILLGFNTNLIESSGTVFRISSSFTNSLIIR